MKMNNYLRDGRAPIPSSENVSKVMRANKGKDTKPELKLRRALSQVGLKGYRLNYKNAPGRPDIAFVNKKIAIFVNGCFWHRCPYCKLSLPKSNKTFWKLKFDRNVSRDKRKKKELRTLGWDVFVFWECQIKKDATNKANKIYKFISQN